MAVNRAVPFLSQAVRTARPQKGQATRPPSQSDWRPVRYTARETATIAREQTRTLKPKTAGFARFTRDARNSDALITSGGGFNIGAPLHLGAADPVRMVELILNHKRAV